MIHSVVEGVIEFVPRVVGWSFLKAVTFGRYRGFRDADLLAEGAIGLALMAGAGYLAWRFWTR